MSAGTKYRIFLALVVLSMALCSIFAYGLANKPLTDFPHSKGSSRNPEPDLLIFRLNEVRLLSSDNIGDFTDKAVEARLLMVFFDLNSGKVLGGFGYPHEGNIEIEIQDVIPTGYVMPALDLSEVEGDVGVYMAVFDVDENTSIYFDVIKGAAISLAGAALTEGTSLAWELIVGEAAGLDDAYLTNLIERADLVDETIIYLNQAENWQEGDQHQVNTNAGRIDVKYQVFLYQPSKNNIFAKPSPPVDLTTIEILHPNGATTSVSGAIVSSPENLDNQLLVPTSILPDDPRTYPKCHETFLGLAISSRVKVADDLRVRIWQLPDKTLSALITIVPDETVLKVEDGPVCFNGDIWWLVKVMDGEYIYMTGWITEMNGETPQVILIK